MAYATAQDLIDRFGEDELVQLTDRALTGGYDAAVVNAALADAGALVEGYLAGRYRVPVAPVPPLLRRLACDIARHVLHGKAAGETVRAGHDDALRVLRDLADGRAALAGATAATGADVPAAAPGRVLYQAPERRFDPERLAGFLA